MSTDTNNSTVTARVFAASVRANVPVLLWGLPGIGKSAIINAWGKSWGYHVETVVGSNREPSDFMGLPIEVDGQTKYADLAWARRLAEAERGIGFFDELTTSPPSVQRVMLRVLQERTVGEFLLPDSVALVAAANPADIAVDGWELAAPVANRLLHLDWQLSADDWLSGFVSDFAHTSAPTLESILNDGSAEDALYAKSLIVGFLKHRPDFLLNVPSDPALAGRGWPSPRSWTNLGAVLSQLNRDDEAAYAVAARGLVGEGSAKEFMAWVKSTDLYDPDEVLADPSIVDWSNRPDRIFALMTAVVGITQMRGGKKTWEAAMKVMVACAQADRADLAYPGTRALLQTVPTGAKPPDAAVIAFSDLFTRMGKWQAA